MLRLAPFCEAKSVVIRRGTSQLIWDYLSKTPEYGSGVCLFSKVGFEGFLVSRTETSSTIFSKYELSEALEFDSYANDINRCYLLAES